MRVEFNATLHKYAVQLNGYAFFCLVLATASFGYLLFLAYENYSINFMDTVFAYQTVLPLAIVGSVFVLLTFLLCSVALAYSRATDFILSFAFSLAVLVFILAASSFLFYLANE